ncbi:phytase, partial [Lysobacter sp. D1-1-M9]
MNRRLLFAALAVALLSACAGLPETTTPAPPRASPSVGPGDSGAITVAERYLSEADGSDELDSLATWPRPEGGTWL